MKLKVIHKKPSAYHLFYPDDEITRRFLDVFNPTRPAKAFTYDQMKELKALGFEIEKRIHDLEPIEEVEL